LKNNNIFYHFNCPSHISKNFKFPSHIKPHFAAPPHRQPLAAKKGFIFTTLIEHAEKNIYIVVLSKN
jgi:hypothetical protein